MKGNNIKVFLSLDYCTGFSVFKSIAIIVTRVIICSFHQCIVEYTYWSANIL